jgi:uncharacterized MAPEG superfamily protein
VVRDGAAQRAQFSVSKRIGWLRTQKDDIGCWSQRDALRIDTMTDVHLLLLAAFLTWFSLMLASGLRSSTAGMTFNFGNREQQPPLSPLAGRADRAAKNLVENMPIFIAVVVAARFAGASSDAIVPGECCISASIWSGCLTCARQSSASACSASS